VLTWTGIFFTDNYKTLCNDRWLHLEPGLELGTFPCSSVSNNNECEIKILRIDPHRFELRLLNASASEQGTLLTARQWSKKYNLIAAINASMYQQDFKTSVSLMKTIGHINNLNLSKDKAILVFDRINQKVPKVQIIDRECQNFHKLKASYNTFIQSIRMVSCRRKNVWRQQDKKFSTAAVGIDSEGNLLFIHVRQPMSTHEVINILLKLPLNLKNAMYVEGGSEAQLFVQSTGQEFEFTGKYESFFIEPGTMLLPRPIPNVIGVVRAETDRGSAK
jgi:uncharacterized protein YigE (DUF2233 family)